MNELRDLKTIQKALQEVLNPFERILKVKAGKPQALEDLRKTIERFPAGSAAGKALDEVRRDLDAWVKETAAKLREQFRVVEATFIKKQKADGVFCKEVQDGWRVGPLEVKLRREQAQACVLYCHQEVVRWRSIDSPEAFDKLADQAQTMLSRSELPDDLRAKVLLAAYKSERARRESHRTSNAAAVPILDFYREVRAQLVRHELAGKAPDRRLAYAELPRWAFVYNLDRYRAEGKPGAGRLAFQTGSQAEQAKGMGLTINGLRATDDYKVYCYVVEALAGAG